ncbi:YeeE/YedE family protein [Maritalea sp.]|uniref:YeeE/YedE family protein n=1 Tax=Maritalea sp. TaxID=2003361 RepID=UPI003EFA4C14
MIEPLYGLPLAGIAVGVLLGYVARVNVFCTLSAFEKAWYSGDTGGLRTWGLAALVAAIITQIAISTGTLNLSSSFYLTTDFAVGAYIIGGVFFGLGMALVGTCGFGALIRLGGGSLKGFVAFLVIGITALATARGTLSPVRIFIEQNSSIDLSFAADQSIPSLVASVLGSWAQLPTMIILLAAVAFWVFKSKEFRHNKSGLLTGTIVGGVIASGWWITSYFQQISFAPVQLESASFVLPLGDGILQFIANTGVGPDYGVGLVFGTILGAAIGAIKQHSVRWEACDDARELGRHIAGAAFMGFGGILALGCTIGQGLSAASLLTVSAPIVFLCVALGARIGLAYLLGGRIFQLGTQ